MLALRARSDAEPPASGSALTEARRMTSVPQKPHQCCGFIVLHCYPLLSAPADRAKAPQNGPLCKSPIVISLLLTMEGAAISRAPMPQPPHPEEAAKPPSRRVGGHRSTCVPSWFETRLAALLTMRRESRGAAPVENEIVATPRRRAGGHGSARHPPACRRRPPSAASSSTS
jgi:hypothetical protein